MDSHGRRIDQEMERSELKPANLGGGKIKVTDGEYCIYNRSSPYEIIEKQVIEA